MQVAAPSQQAESAQFPTALFSGTQAQVPAVHSPLQQLDGLEQAVPRLPQQR
jgi:hypothetical protein